MRTCLLILAFAVSLCGLSAMGDDPPRQVDCFTGSGENPVLSSLAHSRHGLLLVFPQGVNSMSVMLRGPTSMVEYWTDRSRIGDSKYAVVPHRDDPCAYGCGFGQIPPIVAVRLFGRLEGIGSIVYTDGRGRHARSPAGTAPLRLCDIYDSAVETACGTTYGLMLVLETGVDSMTCELGGPNAAIEYWTVRADIGDSSEATLLEPATPPDECDTWVKEFGNDPPIVGMRLFGGVVKIDEIVRSD